MTERWEERVRENEKFLPIDHSLVMDRSEERNFCQSFSLSHCDSTTFNHDKVVEERMEEDKEMHAGFGG